MSKRAGCRSEEQKEMLIDFIESNPDLKTGKFSSTFTYKTSQNLWNSFAAKANVGPANKDWRQWRKTWQDMRSKAKSKKAAQRSHMNATGGGLPYQEELNELDERVTSIFGGVTIEGHPNTTESRVHFNFDDRVEYTPIINVPVTTRKDVDHNYAVDENLEVETENRPPDSKKQE